MRQILSTTLAINTNLCNPYRFFYDLLTSIASAKEKQIAICMHPENLLQFAKDKTVILFVKTTLNV
jgi:hypothetical protein